MKRWIFALVLSIIPSAVFADSTDIFTYSYPHGDGPTLTFHTPISIDAQGFNFFQQGLNTWDVWLGSNTITFDCTTPQFGCDAEDTFQATFGNPYATVANGVVTGFIPGTYDALAFFPGTNFSIGGYDGQVLTITDPPASTPELATIILLWIGAMFFIVVANWRFWGEVEPRDE